MRAKQATRRAEASLGSSNAFATSKPKKPNKRDEPDQPNQQFSPFEDVLSKGSVDIVMVVGDVNSTVACALTAAKCQIPVAHVEARLRSFDRTMPEGGQQGSDACAGRLFIYAVCRPRPESRSGRRSEWTNLSGWECHDQYAQPVRARRPHVQDSRQMHVTTLDAAIVPRGGMRDQQ